LPVHRATDEQSGIDRRNRRAIDRFQIGPLWSLSHRERNYFSVILSVAKDLARSAYLLAPDAGTSVEILRYSSFRSE
jgi:hypothetical protein